MPTAKTKGASSTYYYQPVSEYVNNTLAQKREYWRTKKREQRARLSKHRGRLTQDWQGKKTLGVDPSAVERDSISDHVTVASCPTTTNYESFKTASSSTTTQFGTTAGIGSVEETNSQRMRWLETAELNKAILHLSRSSQCVSSKAAGSEESAVKCLTRCMKKTITSVQLAVPSVKATRAIDENERTMQVEFRVCPKILATKVNAGIPLTPSSGLPSKAEGKETNTPPTGGTKSALVPSHTAHSASCTQPSLDPEEEKTAKRREHWRLKKREQRAKLAKAREKMHSSDMLRLRQTGQNARVPNSTMSRHSVPQTCLQELGQKQCSFQFKGSFRFAIRKNNKLQICKNSIDKSANLTAYPVKRPGEAQKKLHAFAHLSNVSRGIARYKIPRKKFIEVQKNQRNRRCKSPMFASVCGNRNAPKIDPSDTPEHKIAKQREYWRNKKREQRAKLSYEVKAQLKKKDSLMHRVKRYQKVLEELKCARAHSAGTSLTLPSETIGGFIKEDGTMTNNVPQMPAYPNTARGKTSPVTDYHFDSKQKKMAPRGASQPPLGQLPSKPLQLVSVGRGDQLKSANSSSCTFGQLTLTHHPASPMAGSAPEHTKGGCVMKMAISTAGPCANAELTEEERMAKKREYWRIKKREQRAAHAAQLKKSLLQAKITAAFNRRKVQNLATACGEPLVKTLENDTTQNAQPVPDKSSTTRHPSMIKQESETLPEVDPERVIRSPTSPTPPSEPWPPEPDPALGADSQVTTLLAVASMKKLLEESLTRVVECKTEVASNDKVEPIEGDLDSETKPNLSPLSLTREEGLLSGSNPTMLDTKSWNRDVHEVSRESSASHNRKEASHTGEEQLSPLSSKLASLCAQSSQAVKTSTESTFDPSLPRNHEPPKLHHLPVSHQRFEQQCQVAQYAESSSGGLSGLQKRREYWKLMKRQQRARLRARLAERRGGCCGPLLDKRTQALNVTVCHSVEGFSPQADLQLETGVSPSLAITALPDCELHKRHTQQLRYPVEEFWQDEASSGPQLHVHSQTSASTDSSPFLPALKPPDNPLFSINLQPIEPTGQSPNPSLRPEKIPHGQVQNLTHEGLSTLVPVRPVVPPKLIPGDCEEDFLRRRREYWRIKKKEQRAKKATREKVGAQRRTSAASWRSILPSQDCGQWATSEGEPQQVASAAADADLGSFPYSGCSRASAEGAAGCQAKECEEAPLSDAAWRSCYLMDYDPLHQLLVCTVCGELQYSHSVEAARGHIDEAHPDTLSMDEAEKRRILEAWDEQVSQREQFLISQLQQ